MTGVNIDFQTLLEVIVDAFRPYSFLILLGSIVFAAISGYLTMMDQKRRAEPLSRMVYIIIAILILNFAVAMSMQVKTVVYKYSSTMLSGGSSTVEAQADMSAAAGMDQIGLGEKVLISMMELVAMSMEAVKGWFIGSDAELKDILFKNNRDLFFNFEVSFTDSSGTHVIDLYNYMLLFVAVITLILIMRRAYSIMTARKLEDAEEETKALFLDLMKLSAKVIMIPTLLYFMATFASVFSSQFGKIDVGSYADAKTLDPYQYGLGISVAKIYITFMEMKLFLIMWFRKFIINALILVAPIAIALKEAEPEFVSTETWLTLAIKYMFLPVYYGICFLVAVIFIGNLSEKKCTFRCYCLFLHL